LAGRHVKHALKMDEKTLNRNYIYRGKIINLRVDTVRLPNRRQASREIVEHPGAVAIVPVLDNGRIVLVKQFRKPVEKALLEIPAGKLEKDEPAKDCASRELEEETGFRAKHLNLLLSFYPSPGFSDECIHVFKATGLSSGKMEQQSDEFIERVLLDPSEILSMIKAGQITDAKTIIGLASCGLIGQHPGAATPGLPQNLT